MKNVDIGFVYPTYFGEEFGEIVTKELEHPNLRIYLKAEEPKTWASAEWAIPGIISAYILKPYFEAFLKEAGKDHYNLLSKWLKQNLKIGKKAEIEVITGESSPNKLDKLNTQSKAISVHIQVKDGRIIKFMFDDTLTEDDWLNGMDKALLAIEAHYNDFPKDQLSLELKPLEPNPAFEIFAIIDKDMREWKFFDLNKMMQERNKAK